MGLYDQIYARLNGQPMAENTTLDLSLEGDNQEVLTIWLGFDGISPSPKVRRITGTEVIPASGFEIDIERLFLESTECEFSAQFGGSGKTLTTRGYFTKAVKIAAGVGKTATMDFEFVARPTLFE